MSLTLLYDQFSGYSAGPKITASGYSTNHKLVVSLGDGRYAVSLWPNTETTFTGDYDMSFVVGELDGTVMSNGTTVNPSTASYGPFANRANAICQLPGANTIVTCGTYHHGPGTTETLGLKIYEIDGSNNLSLVYDVDNILGNCEIEGVIGLLGYTDEKFVAIRSQPTVSGGGGGSIDVYVNICEWDGVSLTVGPDLIVYGDGTNITKAWMVHQSEFEVIIWMINGTTDRINAVRLSLLSESLGNVQVVPISIFAAGDPDSIAAARLDDQWSIVVFEVGDDLTGVVARVTSSTLTMGLPDTLTSGISPAHYDLIAPSSSYGILAYLDTTPTPAEIHLLELDISIGSLSVTAGDSTMVDDGTAGEMRWPALDVLPGGGLLLRYARVTGVGAGWWAAFIGSEPGQKVLGACVSAGGSYLYTTLWIGGELALQVRDMSDLSTIVYDWSLGVATLAEVDNKTYWAFPMAGGFSDDEVIVFGRMNDPSGLGLVHVIYSADAGVNFSTMVDDWGDDHCGAMVSNGVGQVFAIRNIVSALGGSTIQAKLYRGLFAGALSLVSTLPFSCGVNPGAIDYDQYGTVSVAADTAGSVMVVYAQGPNYLLWVDNTNNYQTTDPVNTLEVIT